MVMGYLLLKKGKSAPGTSGAPVLAKRGTPNGTCPASRASSSRPINGSPENRPIRAGVRAWETIVPRLRRGTSAQCSTPTHRPMHEVM
jgi:hypothetical protein